MSVQAHTGDQLASNDSQNLNNAVLSADGHETLPRIGCNNRNLAEVVFPVRLGPSGVLEHGKTARGAGDGQISSKGIVSACLDLADVRVQYLFLLHVLQVVREAARLLKDDECGRLPVEDGRLQRQRFIERCN